MRRWIGIGIIVAIIAAGSWWYLRGRSQPEEDGELPTAQVTRGDLLVTVAATGVLEPLTTVEVKSRSGGEIKTLYVEAGDYVEAGQLIAQLDPTDLQSQVDQARAQVRSANARVQQSHYSAEAQEEQTRTQTREARASLETARARLRQAEIQLEQTRQSTEQQIVQATARLDSARAAGAGSRSGGDRAHAHRRPDRAGGGEPAQRAAGAGVPGGREPARGDRAGPVPR
ncbi:MAG: biotin/lipoyl-binding protein [Armatimonadota bacterium]|nr:biotin/lipoyl-binding protein [Armatimonadota bacterium]